MTGVSKKVHFPKTRLSELAARPGGVVRDKAISEAAKGVDNLRDHAVTTIELETGAIQTILQSSKGGIATEDMRKILRHADSIVTMAATFGMVTLEKITKSLCDIADGLMSRDLHDVAPIAVHVQSIRLAAPGKPEIGAAAAEHVLAELSKVRTHYGFASLSAHIAAEADPAAVA